MCCRAQEAGGCRTLADWFPHSLDVPGGQREFLQQRSPPGARLAAGCRVSGEATDPTSPAAGQNPAILSSCRFERVWLCDHKCTC